MIRLRVLLFAQLAHDMGTTELKLLLPQGATVTHALNALAQQHPRIHAALPSLAPAVNEAYALPDQSLHDHDTLALISPVSGG